MDQPPKKPGSDPTLERLAARIAAEAVQEAASRPRVSETERGVRQAVAETGLSPFNLPLYDALQARNTYRLLTVRHLPAIKAVYDRLKIPPEAFLLCHLGRFEEVEKIVGKGGMVFPWEDSPHEYATRQQLGADAGYLSQKDELWQRMTGTYKREGDPTKQPLAEDFKIIGIDGRFFLSRQPFCKNAEAQLVFRDIAKALQQRSALRRFGIHFLVEVGCPVLLFFFCRGPEP